MLLPCLYLEAFYMQIIIYKFVDGTMNAVEVTDELYLIHLELVQMEKRNHWRETRRHISLNYLIENGIDFEVKSSDTLAIIIWRENIERVHKALLTLSDKRRELVHKVFYEGMTMRSIARERGVSHSSISQQMATIRKRLQKQLRDCNI